VVDEFTYECLAIDVAGSIRSKRVIEVLSRLISTHGTPLFLRSDNGPEVVSGRRGAGPDRSVQFRLLSKARLPPLTSGAAGGNENGNGRSVEDITGDSSLENEWVIRFPPAHQNHLGGRDRGLLFLDGVLVRAEARRSSPPAARRSAHRRRCRP
jgi:hypothetical protein